MLLTFADDDAARRIDIRELVHGGGVSGSRHGRADFVQGSATTATSRGRVASDDGVVGVLMMGVG